MWIIIQPHGPRSHELRADQREEENGPSNRAFIVQRQQAVTTKYSVKLLIVCLFAEQMYEFYRTALLLLSVPSPPPPPQPLQTTTSNNWFFQFSFSPEKQKSIVCARFSFTRLEFIIYTFFFFLSWILHSTGHWALGISFSSFIIIIILLIISSAFGQPIN